MISQVDTTTSSEHATQAEILAAKPFSEILAPFRESFQRSGLTEEEFDQLIEEELKAMRKEKRQQSTEEEHHLEEEFADYEQRFPRQ